jgi:transcription-repair coupling factor (superfamily II helicase)
MVAELTDRFGPLPGPVANLLALVRLKTEAARLGYESLAMREGEVVLKSRRGVTFDRIAIYKRFRRDASVQMSELRLPRRLLPAETQAWLATLHELLPLLVGAPPSASGVHPLGGAAPRASGAGTSAHHG